jgi:hypothetical protein
MSSRKNFQTAGHVQNEKPAQSKIPCGQFTFPLIVLILLSIFTSFAFTPIGDKTSYKKASLPVVFAGDPTPIPNDSPKDNLISYQASLPSSKNLPINESDLDFVAYRYHSWDIPDEITNGSNFWIEIDLTNQVLYAYRDNQLISGFKVSTGTSSYKTVTGTYKIFSKYPAITMTGPGYDLPNVPYSMFFYKGFSIHGTYWHHNFGTPMSHGCVNMKTADAAWIYENAPVGTSVMVHY